MEKSAWVKIIWLGAAIAIPVAVIAVQKPQASRAAAAPRRVMTVDQPVSVDIDDRQIEGARLVEPAQAASVELAKPNAMRLGGDKITMKGSGSAAPKTEPAPGATIPSAPAEALPAPSTEHLTTVLAPVVGPNATRSP